MSQQFHHIPSLITSEELANLEKLIGEADFVDGKLTASMAVREVKNNLQLQTDGTNPIQEILAKAINSSPYFQAAAQPKQVHPFIIRKYTPGKYYGWHVDSPLMGDPIIRTDMAMTIFLSDPSTYEGELYHTNFRR